METTRRAGAFLNSATDRTGGNQAPSEPARPLFDDDIDAAIARLIEQWNIAERRIKRAEFVKANEIVASAIFELRYAGRKLIDANELLLGGQWRADPAEKTRILTFIADATEDCVKAKHDAIDAMMLFVAHWFRNREDRISLKELLRYFPDYVRITGLISDIQERIALTRGSRTTLRDSGYDAIEATEFEDVLGLFKRMHESEPRIHAEVTATRRKQNLLVGLAIASFLVAVVSLGVAIFK